jgi:hypothetical protein
VGLIGSINAAKVQDLWSIGKANVGE